MAERFNRTRDKTARARALRRPLTKAETHLWVILRNAALGAPFRKQHPLGPYIVDFYCAPLKLAIEVDGGQHAERAGYDGARTAFLARRGVKVLRFWNNDVLEGADGVAAEIGDAVRARKAAKGQL